MRDEGLPNEKLPDDLPASEPADELDEFDDQFLAQIVAFDESLERGEGEAPLGGLSSEERKRFQGIQDCLFLLASARDYERIEDDETEASDDGGVPPARHFGRFELVRRLGAGGSGVVYLARDPLANRLVALKVPLPAWFCREDLVERFMREGEAAARLNHPNIVTVFEVAHLGPVCYIASEYCEGASLAAYIESRPGPIDQRAAAELLVALADAVHHAHLRGVLHRDLKPENILLVAKREGAEQNDTADISDFVPKIGDFGLAKIRDEVDDGTRSNAILGSVLYMSPEQASGSVQEITAQTDIYGLGAILYELLTGRPPLCGSTKLGTLQLIVSTAPKSPRHLRPDTSADLAAICMKCLEKQPARRYASAVALAEDLRRFLAGQPTIARPLGPFKAALRWIERHPARAALIAVSLAALTIAFVATTVYNAWLEEALALAHTESTHRQRLLYSADIRLAQDAWRAQEFGQCARILSRHMPQDKTPDLREFAWHYLSRQCQSELHTLRGHRGGVYCVTFSPDGQTLVSCGKDGTIRTWEPHSGKPLNTFKGHSGEVNIVVATSTNTICSASDDGTVRVWDATSGKELRRLDGHRDIVFGMDLSSDERWLISGDQAGTLCLWDVQTGAKQWSREGLSPIESLSFAPRDGRFVSAHSDGMLRWWDGQSGKMVHESQATDGSAVTATYSPLFARVASAGRNGSLATHRRLTSGWQMVASDKLDAKAIGIHGLAFSPRDNALAVGRRDGLVELWNAGNQLTSNYVLPGHRARVWSVAWSPDGRLLASSASDGTIKLWDGTQARSWCATYPQLTSPTLAVAVSPNQRTLLTASADGQVRSWDRATRLVREVVSSSDDECVGIGFVAAGDTAIVTQAYSGLFRCDLERGTRAQIATLPALAYCQALSTDGRFVAVGCEKSTAVVLDVETGSLKQRVLVDSLAVKHVALSHDGGLLATAGVGEPIELWETATGKRVRRFNGHPNRTLCLAFAPDGATLASGGSDQDVRLWDVASGALLETLVGQSAAITALAISPDGRNLVSGSSEPAFLQLWDLETQQPLLQSGKSADTVTSLVFTQDGRTVVGTTAAGSMIEWSLDNTHTLNANQRAETFAVRPLMFGHDDSQRDVDVLEMMQAAHRFARQAGFAAGYPTFHRNQDGTKETMRVVLLSDERARPAFVSHDELYTAILFAPADEPWPGLVPRLMRACDPWYHKRGFKGALLGFSGQSGGGRPAQFDVTLVGGSQYKRRLMPLEDLIEERDIEEIFRRVHAWSVEQGQASGFPTFAIEDGQLGCVTVTPEQAELRDVPLVELEAHRP